MKTTTQLTSIALLTALSCSVASAALTTTTTYTGSGPLIDVTYNNTAGTRGRIDAVLTDSWDNGLPSDSNPGLFTGGTAQTATGANVWYGVAVRQTGGTLADTALAMRGGDEEGLRLHSTLEIDDASNTDFSTTNLAISGQLTLWTQFGTGNTLSVLNGYADVGILAGTGAADQTVNILNGRLDAGSFSNANVTVNMLAGGTGEFNLADMSGTAEAKSQLGNMVLNFDTGSLASFTIVSDGGADAGDYWANNFTVGDVQIDGANVTDLSGFTITDFGDFGTTISLIPEPGTYALLAGCFALASVMIRRRR